MQFHHQQMAVPFTIEPVKNAFLTYKAINLHSIKTTNTPWKMRKFTANQLHMHGYITNILYFNTF